MKSAPVQPLFALVVLAGCADDGSAPTPSAPEPDVSAAASSGPPDAGAPRDVERWFVDVTASSGLEFVHDDGATPEKHLPETMGGGAALFDADEDGDLDLYCVQSGRLPTGLGPNAFRPANDPSSTNRLYLNDGSGRFEDATERSGDAAQTGYGQGVVYGDVDGDGHDDLYVTNLGPDVLLLGDGTGRFRDATPASGLAGPTHGWTGGACLFDADADGDLDLYVVGYVSIDMTRPEWCGQRKPGWRSYCHPDRYTGLGDSFWRNRGDGTFEEATDAAGLADSAGKGLGAIATDVDRDGDLDLYVANDSVENRLWQNDGRGRFTDWTLVSGTGVNRLGATEAGMGLASADVDGDGKLDLFVTNFDNESNTLYSNEGEGFFDDGTVAAGLEAASRLPVGFGCVLEDFDLDGDPDLCVANGHIIDNIQLYHDGKTHAQPAQVFENVGGRFTERANLGAEPWVGRGLVAGDLDLDGDVDLVLVQCGGPARVFENRAGGRSWTLLGLPRGAGIELTLDSGRVLFAEAGPQPSYYSQGAPWQMFGLGSAAVEGLRVRPLGSSWHALSVPDEGHRFVVRGPVSDLRLETASPGRGAHR